MKVRYLNGRRLYYAFLAGAQEVDQNRHELNRMNVFPIADGDTGTNLALTLHHVLDEVHPVPGLHQTLGTIAEAALTGARGNSGMILAQFLNGLALELHDRPATHASSFASSLVRAVPHAYKAVSHPVEGTMLTVIRAWAKTFQELCQTSKDFAVLLTRSLEQARHSLRGTPDQLDVLRKASVVDSGAQGFVHFIEGMVKLVHTGPPRRLLRSREQVRFDSVPVSVEASCRPAFRYCAEGHVLGEHIPLDEVRAFLERQGDSVILAGSASRIRFHLHTDHPAKVFTSLRHYGRFLQQKVDDMQRQQDALYRRGAPIALATDSIADLPQEVMDRHQVHLLPLQVNVDGSNFLDRVTLAPGQLFALLEEVQEYPTSSQPTAQQAREWLGFLATHYESVLVLTVSSHLSGTYHTLCRAAQELQLGERLAIVDSRLNSAAQGLLVLNAAQKIEAGIDRDALVASIEAWIDRSYIFVSVATFEYMVRGGRVSPLKGKLAKWLNLKPIVSLDKEGKGIALGKAFSQRANTRGILRHVAQLHARKAIDKYCIVHADAPQKAADYERQLTQLLGKPPEYTTEISPIVALNAGRGAVAVAVMQGTV